jgi:hypothetical protein
MSELSRHHYIQNKTQNDSSRGCCRSAFYLSCSRSTFYFGCNCVLSFFAVRFSVVQSNHEGCVYVGVWSNDLHRSMRQKFWDVPYDTYHDSFQPFSVRAITIVNISIDILEICEVLFLHVKVFECYRDGPVIWHFQWISLVWSVQHRTDGCIYSECRH